MQLVHTGDNYGGGASGILLIFFDYRPFNRGELWEDFKWRHQVKYTTDTNFRKEIVQVMGKKFGLRYNLGDLVFSFSKKAGCRMCPCSPGIVVKSKVGDNSRNCPWIVIKGGK